MYERAGLSSDAFTNSKGRIPRATATAAPTMCLIWYNIKDRPVTLTCAMPMIHDPLWRDIMQLTS